MKNPEKLYIGYTRRRTETKQTIQRRELKRWVTRTPPITRDEPRSGEGYKIVDFLIWIKKYEFENYKFERSQWRIKGKWLANVLTMLTDISIVLNIDDGVKSKDHQISVKYE